MYQGVSWRDRLLVGLGIVFSIGVVALPALVRKKPARPARQAVVEPADPVQWFGLSSRFDLRGLVPTDASGPQGSSWEAVGPLQFVERGNGSARLTGFLRETSTEGTFLQVDLDFSERMGSEPGSAQPGSYAQVSGFLRGLGSLAGGLLSVETGPDAALNCSARHGEVALRTEWLQMPADSSLRSSARKGTQRFSLDFSREAVWGTRDMQFNLGGIEGDFVLLAGGHFVERADGSAALSAVLAQRGYQGRAFHLELSAQQSDSWNMAPIENSSRNPLVGPTGLMGVEDAADPASWRSYDQFSGTLRGMDEFEGALIELSSASGSLNVGVGLGLEQENDSQGAAAICVADFLRGSDTGTFNFVRGRARSSFSMTLGQGSLQFAYDATSHSSFPKRSTFAVNLGELGEDFVFEAGGFFAERQDGGAHLSGQLVSASDESLAYYIDVELGQRRANFGSFSERPENWTGFESWAFTNNGGPLSPSFWRNYESLSGRLVGLRGCQGNDYELSATDSPFQVGVGANGRSMSEGVYGTFAMRSSHGDSLEMRSGFVSCDLRNASEEATQVVQGALWIDQIGSDFSFTSGGRLRQTSDGRATVSGIVSRAHFPMHRFFMTLRLSDRIDPSWVEADQPAWTQFGTVEGQLVGLDELRGSLLSVSSTGGVASFGLGAHGDPESQGAQVPFDLHVVTQPSSEVRFRSEDSRAGLAMGLSRTLELRAEEALAASYAKVPGGHALSLPGIAKDFIFPEGGLFQEFANGTATLEGRLISLSEPNLGFDIQIDFAGRFHEQKLANVERTLPSTAYVERKGPVDTGLWHFYRSSRGILVGTQDLAGAVLQVSFEGTALQVGQGANGRNLEHGAAGDLVLELLSQPVGGRAILPEDYPGGEIHIDLPSAGNQ